MVGVGAGLHPVDSGDTTQSMTDILPLHRAFGGHGWRLGDMLGDTEGGSLAQGDTVCGRRDRMTGSTTGQLPEPGAGCALQKWDRGGRWTGAHTLLMPPLC